MIIGDLPPYEAFPIGGTASVRGYSEGGVGSGRNYVAGTAELHFPLMAPVEVSKWDEMQALLDFMLCSAGLSQAFFLKHSFSSIFSDPCLYRRYAVSKCMMSSVVQCC